jgi:hypothetical protein
MKEETIKKDREERGTINKEYNIIWATLYQSQKPSVYPVKGKILHTIYLSDF